MASFIKVILWLLGFWFSAVTYISVALQGLEGHW